jgi:hypothetical protein
MEIRIAVAVPRRSGGGLNSLWSMLNAEQAFGIQHLNRLAIDRLLPTPIERVARVHILKQHQRSASCSRSPGIGADSSVSPL